MRDDRRETARRASRPVKGETVADYFRTADLRLELRSSERDKISGRTPVPLARKGNERRIHLQTEIGARMRFIKIS
jgi:hypothetical protein